MLPLSKLGPNTSPSTASASEDVKSIIIASSMSGALNSATTVAFSIGGVGSSAILASSIGRAVNSLTASDNEIQDCIKSKLKVR